MADKVFRPCYKLGYYQDKVMEKLKIGKKFDLLVYGSDDMDDGRNRTMTVKAIPLEMHDTFWRLSVTKNGRVFYRCVLIVDLWNFLYNGQPIYV